MTLVGSNGTSHRLSVDLQSGEYDIELVATDEVNHTTTDVMKDGFVVEESS